jgi:hypothetical protein
VGPGGSIFSRHAQGLNRPGPRATSHFLIPRHICPGGWLGRAGDSQCTGSCRHQESFYASSRYSSKRFHARNFVCLRIDPRSASYRDRARKRARASCRHCC